MYACTFIEGKACMRRKIKDNEYHGFLPWYWPMVLNTANNIDIVKEYQQHSDGFGPRYWKRT